MPDYLTNTSELTSIANAIRTKGGTSSGLIYPQGFISAIEAISIGGSGNWVDISDEFSFCRLVDEWDPFYYLPFTAISNGDFGIFLGKRPPQYYYQDVIIATTKLRTHIDGSLDAPLVQFDYYDDDVSIPYEYQFLVDTMINNYNDASFFGDVFPLPSGYCGGWRCSGNSYPVSSAFLMIFKTTEGEVFPA